MGLVGFHVTNLVKPALVSLCCKQEINAFYLWLIDLSAANDCFFLTARGTDVYSHYEKILLQIQFNIAIMVQYFENTFAV